MIITRFNIFVNVKKKGIWRISMKKMKKCINARELFKQNKIKKDKM